MYKCKGDEMGMKVLMFVACGGLGDGINRHVQMITRGLRARGAEVTVCSLWARGEFLEALEAEGVPTFSLGGVSGHGWRALWRFARVVREVRPDVVHLHNPALSVQMALRLLFPRLPVVMTTHTLVAGRAEAHPFGPRAKQWWRGLLEVRLRRWIFVSQGQMEHAGNPPNGVVICNPMSFAPLKPGSARLPELLGVPEGTPLIGTVGRINWQKNPQSYSRVMCVVLRERTDMHAVVIGSGARRDMEESKAIVATSGVADRFHFLGHRTDAPTLVGDLNCFVMTSVWEGLPTSLLEAVRAKVPIAFMEGKGGLVDLARLNKTEGPLAVVAPQGDEKGLAQGILRLLAQPEEAKARAERAYTVARQRYALEPAAQALENLYRTVMAED